MVVASTPQQHNHYLIVRDDQGERDFALTESKYTLGRKSDCTIYLDSHFVSRLHATLLRCLRNDGTIYYRLVDGDGLQQMSANGIIVNGKKVAACELKHDDKVVFGPQVYAIYQYREDGTDFAPDKIAKEEDPFDITLIDPAMIQEEGEEDISTQLINLAVVETNLEANKE